MRKISDAARIAKISGKILALLEKEELTDEQINDVIRSTESALGMKPAALPTHEMPSEV